MINAPAINVKYRRRYGFKADGSCGDGSTTCGFTYAGGGDRFNAGSIVTLGSAAASYSAFYAPTRLAIARAALYQAVKQNQNVARFGLVKMRQNVVTQAVQCSNNGPVGPT